MELPAEVLIHNRQLGLKGGSGTLLNISDLGFFEVNLVFGENVHRVLLPIAETVLISRAAEERPGESLEIER
jgi:hypothetical protein